jgi:hypothetical protein
VVEFLLDVYVSRTAELAVERGEERARIAAEELAREGTPVCFLRSILVPEDGPCFYLCEAASIDAAKQFAKRAGLPLDRVVESVASPKAGRDAVAPAPTSNARQKAKGDVELRPAGRATTTPGSRTRRRSKTSISRCAPLAPERKEEHE